MNASIDLSRVPLYPQRYIALVATIEMKQLLQQRIETTNAVLTVLSQTQWEYRYAPQKWSVKEVVQHVIDTERIFCYRALCIARGETAALPGFDENMYAAAAEADRRTPEALLREFRAVQQSTAHLFASFSEVQLECTGVANNSPIYVRAIAYIIAGHWVHHTTILRDRYL